MALENGSLALPCPIVIPSEARNLSAVFAHGQKERFLASLGMTK
jgi:hypothetical protein